jgi:hypothetical protein
MAFFQVLCFLYFFMIQRDLTATYRRIENLARARVVVSG